MSSRNDESPDRARDLRRRVANFLGSEAEAELENMSPAEIRFAIKAAFRSVRAWIGEEDANGSRLN